jgi:hypothetical protein
MRHFPHQPVIVGGTLRLVEEVPNAVKTVNRTLLMNFLITHKLRLFDREEAESIQAKNRPTL